MKRLQLATTTDQEIINESLATLRQGGLVIFPTETVYGALVDATNPAAVQKLLRFKRRRTGKPLSIACADQKMASKYVKINDQAQQIYTSLLPGPVTVISQSLDRVAPGVASEFSTLGIRIPAYPLLLDLISQFGRPVTATSANLSGQKMAYSVDDLVRQFSQKQLNQVDLIIDAGQLPKRPPSVVIDTTQSTPIYIRGELPSSPSTNNNTTIFTATTKNTVSYTSSSPEETKLLAQKIIFQHFDQLVASGLIITLDGELGAGKTTFTQGIANFLQLNQTLDSPTYSYMKEYDFEKNDLSGKIFHLDVWRINSAAEMKLLELEKLFAPGNLVIIEWWEQVAPFCQLPSPTLHLTITELADHKRQIDVHHV